MVLPVATRGKKANRFAAHTAALLTLLLAMLSASVAPGQTPRVEFDVACMTPVNEVGDSKTNSLYREIEARLPISILLASGNQNQLSEVVIRIESRHRDGEVVDFAPRTRLASSVIGNVEVTERGDERKHAKIDLFGVVPAAPTVKGTASAGYHDERQAVWSYERLPPHEVLVASGTTDRGFGAFFKFRPSSQASLEGSHDLLLRLRVPKAWRSEIYDVTAIAYARRGKEISFDDRPIAGQESFTLVFYQAGDEEVRQAGARLAQDEERFKAIVWRDRKSIERKAFPSPFDRVGSVIGVVGPKIPENWYRLLLSSPSTIETEQVMSRLPSEVQLAARDMLDSRDDYNSIRAKSNISTRRAPTPYSTQMARGTPELSAKKPETKWRPRNAPEVEQKPKSVNR